MLPEVVVGIVGQEDRNRASYMGVGLTQARRTAQHSKWGVHILLPLGASPMQGVNQYGHLAHTALQFFIFSLLFQHTTMV